MRRIILYSILTVISLSICGQDVLNIKDDGEGRIFEGIGALSAGASSKLLMDYSPDIRSQIFDFLFRPKFGAGLQIIKIEIGGDVNSTDGSEPSHAHTRHEFLNPEPLYFKRGYEWLVLNEAKRRNPNIFLDCLEWGCPGWIGEGIFYSQDNIDYIISFLEGARRYHQLKFDYTGVWNERPYDAEWIKLLRKSLDYKGLNNVKIIAPDNFDWEIAEKMKNDDELRNSIYAIGIHYNERWEKNPYSSTDVARSLNIPLHNSEAGPWRGDWTGFEYLVKLYNRNYVVGKATRVITWSLITSYYDNLSLPNSGLMTAKSPWSGYYEVQPAIWAAAHTTQFTQPGWRYTDGGCGMLDYGSYVTLKSADNKDFSIVIETMDAIEPKDITISLDKSFSGKVLHVWKSTSGKIEFEQQPDINLKNNRFNIVLDKKSVYSITTTTGQSKGNYKIPEKAGFPTPFKSDFENDSIGQLAKYFMDQGGVFEVFKRADGKGKCLKQVINQKGTEWEIGMNPFVSSVIGDTSWTDYEVRCDINISENTGSAILMGRISETHRNKTYPEGYWLKVLSSGEWALYAGNQVIANGTNDVSAFKWYNLSMKFNNNNISVSINNKEIQTISDSKFKKGLAGIGCDFNYTEFDNFEIKSN